MTSERLRVALLSLYPRDASKILGGVRAAAFNLVGGLSHYDDLELHVVHCHADVAQDAIVTQESENGQPVQVRYLAMPTRRWIPNMTGSIRRVREALQEIQPDVVNAHIGYYALAAIGAGWPTIYTIHGVAREEAKSYQSRLFDRLRYWLYARYDDLAIRRARHLVAISDYVVEANRGRAQGRWQRINNPVTDDFFAAAAPEDPNLVLFVGSITEVKDILTLLKAIEQVRAQLPSVHLQLAGRVTSPTYERELRDYIQAHDLSANVEFLGLLERPALIRRYSEAALVALSSRQENAPMAVIEAMAAGKPVVCTRVGGVAGIVAEDETGYIAPVGDVEALAERMTRLLRDPQLRVRMGRRARERARRDFSVAQTARQYHDLYWQVAREDKA
jgi:glycosyltransferase involved in cell wall biosynthesis